MSSINTNLSSIAALQTLKSVNSNLTSTQQQVSSGLRISSARDNAAYWSIATTMRSDNASISAAKDANGLEQAKVDTAYSGMGSVIDVLDKFNAKLVAAKQDGVDKSKLQSELDQLKQQVVNIAKSSSFSGVNFLNTQFADIYDTDQSTTSLVSSFQRSGRNDVSVDKMDVDLSKISLFNSTGGGLLQADGRDLGKIAGMRDIWSFSEEPAGIDHTAYYDDNGALEWALPSGRDGSPGQFALSDFPVGSPLDFNSPGAQITFDLTLDKEASNPGGSPGDSGNLQQLPGPYFDGVTTPVTITKADVDAAKPSLGGVISTNTEFALVLTTKLQNLGAKVVADRYLPRLQPNDPPIHDPRYMYIETLEKNGNGSYVAISNLNSVGVSTGGLSEGSGYGSRGSGMIMVFSPFIVAQDGKDKDGIDVSFDFSVNNAPEQSYSFDRTYVNNVLGKDNGEVATSDDMVKLLHSMLDSDWPNLIIQKSDSGDVLIKSDPAADRKVGGSTSIAFNNIRVSNEPRSTMNLLDIDVAQNPDLIDGYINYMNTVMGHVTSAAATLGSLQQRLDMQSAFTNSLQDSLSGGIGKLVDANMEHASSKLAAYQTQQQLASQSLQIANRNPQTLLSLFGG